MSDVLSRDWLRPFRVQVERKGKKRSARTVPWVVGWAAWCGYNFRFPGSAREQDAQRIHDRGGFGHGEMDVQAPGWEEAAEFFEALRKQVEGLRAQNDAARLWAASLGYPELERVMEKADE